MANVREMMATFHDALLNEVRANASGLFAGARDINRHRTNQFGWEWSSHVIPNTTPPEKPTKSQRHRRSTFRVGFQFDARSGGPNDGFWYDFWRGSDRAKLSESIPCVGILIERMHGKNGSHSILIPCRFTPAEMIEHHANIIEEIFMQWNHGIMLEKQAMERPVFQLGLR